MLLFPLFDSIFTIPKHSLDALRLLLCPRASLFSPQKF